MPEQLIPTPVIPAASSVPQDAVNNGKAPELYLRGTFNGWGDDTPMQVGHRNGNTIHYQAVICLGADSYNFKIGDRDGSERLTFSAEKYRPTPCYLDTPLTLKPAKGIGNDLVLAAPKTGFYTLVLELDLDLALDPGSKPDVLPVLTVSCGGNMADNLPTREHFSHRFDKISAGTHQITAKPAPLPAPDTLFSMLAIESDSSIAFVFGDNVDGYYEGASHKMVGSGKYRHNQGWLLGGFGAMVNGDILDREKASSCSLTPAGIEHNYTLAGNNGAGSNNGTGCNNASDNLMVFSGQRGAALQVKTRTPAILGVVPELNLAFNDVTASPFEGGMVYALDPALRQPGSPSFVALAGDVPFSVSEQSLADNPDLAGVMYLNGHQAKPVFSTLSPQRAFTLYLAFADNEQDAIEQARALVENDGAGLHFQQCYDHLTGSYLATPDLDYNRALMWSKAAGKVFVSNQFGTGIWAGLPWFKDCWGRDSFIALPGICLANGDFETARRIIDNFAAMQLTDPDHINYGRIPNRVTSETNIIYNTTDGTPWMVREIWDYLRYSGDSRYARTIYPVVQTYIEGVEKHHLDEDGLMTHRHPDTWMDAKLDGSLPWSPRGNRANDIQVLWLTSLEIAANLADMNEDGANAKRYRAMAKKAADSFVALFWDPEWQQLADRINEDGTPDYQVRPNQLMAITVPFSPILDRQSGACIVKNAVSELLFPWGITSLSQYDPDFHPYHNGRSEYHKDAAYHNGTIWGWNAGFTVGALTRFGQQELAWKLSQNLSQQILHQGHRGTMSENLDAFPQEGGKLVQSGTYAQAWSVSEFHRNGFQDYLGFSPDLLNKTVSLAPAMPQSWSQVTAMVPFGMAGNANRLQVKMNRCDSGRLHLRLKLDAPDVLINIELQTEDGARYAVGITPDIAGDSLDFDPVTGEAWLNGKPADSFQIDRSYAPEIGMLDFAKPDNSLDFPVLATPHLLQQRVEKEAAHAARD